MSVELPCILITPHSGHTALIQALQTQGKYRVVVFGGPEFERHLNAARERQQGMSDRRFTDWSATVQSLCASRPFRVSGKDLTPEIANRLTSVLLPNLQGFHLIAEAFERLHRESPLRAIVIHNEVAPNLRLLVALAERHGIQTLHLPHGIPQGRFPMADFDDLIRTTVVGVQGVHVEKWFRENEKNEAARIARVGRPEWDALYRQKPKEDRDEACRILGLDPRRQVVGFAGSWGHTLTTFDLSAMLQDAFRDFLRGMLRLGTDAPQVLIRPHPAHLALREFGPDWHHRVAAEFGVPIVVADAPQETFLAASDLVVALDSTFLTVALLAQRLALAIAWPQPGTETGSIYEGYPGIATCALEPDAIADALRACLSDEEFRSRLIAGRDETLAQLNHGHDGRATERVIALIDTLASSAPAATLVPAGGYYGRINQRLADLIPPKAKRILEVGCAAGYLGAWLKEQDPSREVIGVEAFPSAANEARRRLDVVIEGDVETLSLPYPDGYFDCILYGDVLEHLQNPGAVLAAHRRLLAPDGEVLVCIPNVAHWSVLRELLAGSFTYQDEGLLDRTHLRFFTQKSFAALLTGAGLQPVEAQTIDVPNPQMAAALRLMALSQGIDNPELEAQSNAYQLLFRARNGAPLGASVPGTRSALPDARGFNIVLVSEGPEHIQRNLDAFLAAFSKDEDVALHVLAGATLEQLQGVVLDLLAARGLDPEHIPDVSLLDQPAAGADLPRFLKAADLVIGGPEIAEHARQLGVPALIAPSAQDLRTAKEAPSSVPGSCSVVVVTYNSLRTLEGCIESVLRTMGPNDELIVVDNASTDGTAEVLHGLKGADRRLKVALNRENLGFSAGSNAGLRIATGEYLVLLNPDTIVTPGWLTRMKQPFQDPTVGAVGPTADYVAGLQKYQLYLPSTAHAGHTPDQLATLLAARNAGRTVETKLLIGFCLMAPRRVWEDVGLLDEELFLGNDDLDLSWRLRLAGYRLVVATDAFVHHIGQVSFNSEPSAHTKRLVQESTDALARKLVRHYGPGRVPTAQELWDMTWFTPTPGILDGALPQPAASIVVLTYNQLDVTRLCVDSLFRHTRDFELIVVDNASGDGTVDYLQHLASRHPNVKIILNDQNRGFAGGCNQGIAVAQGHHVVLLNNDTVVGEGWLEGMMAASEAPGIGLVGPRTNCITGPQQVDGVDYDQHSLDGFEVYASEWRRRHAGETLAIQRVIGFCMLIRREVIDRIGGLDLRFGRGNFEDDDFCLRAQVAGFGIVVANDVFIHHFGSVTFKGQKIDYRQAMEENWGKFKRKWLLPEAQPMERGYNLADALALPFDPALHTEPVFSPATAPAELPDRAAFNMVIAGSDETLLDSSLSAYMEAFAPGQGTCLHVLAGPGGTAIQERIMALLERGGFDPANIPDVSLLHAPAIPLDLPRYLAAADLIIGTADIAQGARDMGRPAFEVPSAELLRLAHDRFRDLDWRAEPPTLDARAKERWLCSTSWEAGLATFLAAPGETDRSLIVPVAPGEAERTQEAIAEWLSLHGYAPETIPDVLLLDHSDASPVGLLRAVNVWADSGDSETRAIALALGLRVVSAQQDATSATAPTVGLEA